MEINDLRTQIKELLFDNPIRPVDGPAQTATEISIRHQNFLEEIGPAWGRLSVELLPKVLNRVIYILKKQGKLKEDVKIDSKFVDIRYTSPLEQGASFQSVQNLTKYLELMTQFFGQEVTMATINLPMLPQWLSEKMNVAPGLIATSDKITAMVQQLQQQQQGPTATPQIPNVANQGAAPPQPAQGQ